MSNDKVVKAVRDCCDAHEAYSQALHSIGQVTNEQVHELLEFVNAAEEALRAALVEVEPKVEPVVWKDHNTAQLINRLRDVAVKYHATQQLRAQISALILPIAAIAKGAA